ncbi:exodeoxyribonuclease III [Rhizobium sp. GR12]|uniref:exodeoxyribonuclease III n=1 Tax=Rhizobium sp. GR12 TaxID=3053925 RepID=UPI002FBD8514
MRLATYNINGINGRLDLLLRWLEKEGPDVVCLQELKAPDEKFPRRAIEKAGYGAIWNGQKSWNGVAILARQIEPLETRRSLPGGPNDAQSRYIEAAINGMIVGCLYVPNGNPAPGPKLSYKLSWLRRLRKYAQELLELDVPVALIGDFNVVPTELDVYNPERWRNDALFRPEVRRAFAGLLGQGWIDAVRTLYPDKPVYTFWKYWRNSFERDAGLRIDHFLLSPTFAADLKSAGVDRWVRGLPRTSDHAPAWIEVG